MTAVTQRLAARERPQLRRGESVRIHPGGLPMTVLDIVGGNGNVIVRWESGGKTYYGTFEPWRLERCR